MRKITIRQFQQNFYREILDLPLTVTRKGVNAFEIHRCDVVTSDVVTRQTPVNPEAEDVVTIPDKPVPKLEKHVTTICTKCGFKTAHWKCGKEELCDMCFHKLTPAETIKYKHI